MLRRLFPFPVILFLALWVALAVVGRARMFSDPGTFWHTVLGQKILVQHQLTEHDSFSYTYANQPWLALQWLAEWAMAAVHAWGGFDTLLLATTALLAAFYAWLGTRLTARGMHPILAVFVVALTVAASSHHFLIRPHLGSIILTGFFFTLLCDIDEGRVKPIRLAWLVPLTAIWTNIHGGVLAGVATLGLAVAGWVVWKMTAWLWPGKNHQPSADGGNLAPSPTPFLERVPTPWPTPFASREALIFPLAVGLACLGALLFNPFGADMVEAWLAILRMPLTGLIEEHRPLDITRPEGFITIALGFAYLALLWNVIRTGGWRRLRVTWLVPLVWFLLAASRIRHAPLFAVVGALGTAELVPYSQLAAWLARFELFGATPECQRPLRWREKPWAGIVPASLIMAGLALQAAHAPVPVLGSHWARLDAHRWPIDLLPELKELEASMVATTNPADPDGTPRAAGEPAQRRPRLFHALDYGGFLIYFTPGLKTFIDDRCELYGADFLRQYVAAEKADPQQIAAWDARYHFDAALVPTASPFDRYLEKSPTWQLQRRAGGAALYRRRQISAEQAVIGGNAPGVPRPIAHSPPANG